MWGDVMCGYTYREIAERHGVCKKTVSRHLARLKKALSRELQEIFPCNS